MANYINNEILSEAYSHLDINIIKDAEKLAQLKREISVFMHDRAKFLFGEGVHVEIEFEEGSLRTKVKVIGSAVAIIASATIAYGGFRQAMEYLAKDATLLAESANLEMIYRTRAAHCDRVTIEKRRGVFGRVDELLGEIDLIGRHISDSQLPTNQRALSDFVGYVDRLNAWQKKADKLLNKLPSESSRACIAAGFLEELESFPDVAPWAKQFDGKSFRADLTRADPGHAGRVAGAATQFRETTKHIKKYYEDMVKQAAPAKT